ncbi:MAG: transposase [Phycisphaerae bacterium]
MRIRVIKRYSECFKRQVVEELEQGRFGSIKQVRLHLGIMGAATVPRWLRNYGRNHLMAKVVRAEKSDEQDRVREYCPPPNTFPGTGGGPGLGDDSTELLLQILEIIIATFH